jgi:hypothetical protein
LLLVEEVVAQVMGVLVQQVAVVVLVVFCQIIQIFLHL